MHISRRDGFVFLGCDGPHWCAKRLACRRGFGKAYSTPPAAGVRKNVSIFGRVNPPHLLSGSIPAHTRRTKKQNTHTSHIANSTHTDAHTHTHTHLVHTHNYSRV